MGGHYTVGGSGAVDAATWRDAGCEWQGGSQQPCSEHIEGVAVHVRGMVDFRATVRVCSIHAPAYKRAAEKAGYFS